jgi:hypothetical protein
MSKYIQLSRYYFSDKDLADVLGNSAFSERSLLQIGRQRGFFFSPLEKKRQLVHLLSHVPFDWEGLKDLAEKLNSDEREKKRSTRRLEDFTDLDAINKALNELKTERGAKKQEVYTIHKKGADAYHVDVGYTDIDTSKARAFQRTEAHANIELVKVENRIEVRFSHDERSREVVQALFEKLKASLNKELKAVDIEMTGVRDPALRSQFFVNLRQKLKDFRQIDVLDLAFDRRLPEEVENKEADQEENEEKSEIKAMVRKAAFSGQGLLSSDLTKKLRETGYFISRIKWSAKETKGEERLVEFESGFEDPVMATGFYYDVKKVYPRDDPADKKKTHADLLRAERPRLRNILADAAFISLEEIKTQIEKKSTDANKPK